MRTAKIACTAALAALGMAVAAVGAKDEPAKAELPKPDADGFMTIFNGKDLTGWEGLEDLLVRQGRRHQRP